MLDYVERSDEIKGAVFIWQFLGLALLYPGKASGPAEVERRGGNVNSFCLAEFGQHLEVRTGATTYIQNMRPLWPESGTDAL